MSLMDQAREEAQKAGGTPNMKAGGAPTVKKSHGSEYQKRQKRERYESAMKLAAELKQKNVQLSVEGAAFLTKLCKEPGTGQAFGGMQTPLIYRLFGDAPKAGMKIPALTVFQKTKKGYNEFRQQVKKWADKGVAECHYDESDKDNAFWVLDKVLQLPPKAVPATEV